MVAALAACARTRSGSVARLRSTSQQSNGEGTPPVVPWKSRSRSRNDSDPFTTSAPPSTSL